MDTRRTHVQLCLVLTGVYWAAVLLIDPRGEFPLNDDWGYAPPVASLIGDGALRYTDWQSMPLLTHVLTGSAVAALLGFSHEALRLSTVLLGWLGVVGVYGLAIQLRARPSGAFLAGLLLIANPLYLGLSQTFMTDVPFAVAVVAACSAWLRAERDGRRLWYASAIALAIWATLNRQLGLALPLGWGIAATLRVATVEQGGRLRGLARAWLPFVVVGVALFGYERVLTHTVGLPALYAEKSSALTEALIALTRLRGIRYPLQRSASSLITLGLFALPMLVTVVARERRRMGFAFAGAGVALGLSTMGFRLPFDGNIIVDFGIGPRTVPGHGAVAPEWLWIVLSCLGGFGAGTLVELVVVPSSRWVRALRREGQPPPRETALLFVMLVGFVPTSIAYGPSFDRYLLLQLPLVLAWLALDVVPRSPPDDRRLPRLPIALAAVMLLFSVAATHDYFAWQRARWSLVVSLESDGVERADIEGGMEVDNEQNRRGDAFVAARPEADWVVSFDAAGADDARSADCDPWLPFAPRVVYARRRRRGGESAH